MFMQFVHENTGNRGPLTWHETRKGPDETKIYAEVKRISQYVTEVDFSLTHQQTSQSLGRWGFEDGVDFGEKDPYFSIVEKVKNLLSKICALPPENYQSFFADLQRQHKEGLAASVYSEFPHLFRLPLQATEDALTAATGSDVESVRQALEECKT